MMIRNRGQRIGSKHAAVAVVVALALSGCGETPIRPTPVNEPPPQQSGGQATRIQGIGCYLQAGAAGGGGLASMISSGMVFFPSGNPLVDNFNQQEALNLVQTFRVSPRVFYLVDQSPNALATPEIANAFGPDGTVLLGRNLVTEQLTRDPSGATVVAVMAHEFAHLTQFKHGSVNVNEPVRRMELHADFMAGWYLRLRGQYAWTNLMPALRIFFDLGDYQFNAPQHHGTPAERLSAAQAGFNSGAPDAAQAYALGLQYVK